MAWLAMAETPDIRDIDLFTKELGRLEATMGRREPAGAINPGRWPDALAKVLPEDSVLVQFVAHQRYPLTGPQPLPESPKTHYAAALYVGGKLEFVPLGPAEPIDEAIQTFRSAIQGPGAAKSCSETALLKELLPLARDLYQRMIGPWATFLDGARELVIVPDGELATLPFAALHDGERFLGERLRVRYAPSARFLVLDTAVPVSPGPALILADPAFDVVLADEAPLPEWLAYAQRRALQIDKLDALPGTRDEAQAVVKLLPDAELLVGRAATERALRARRSPRVLHIASHGLFIPSHEDANLDALMARSLLLLSGATAPGPRRIGPADGWLTALELADLDLRGTELVVLSACETGLGDIRIGQGVYGARRAVFLAGARTLVTSLWKVNDEVTRDLMVSFYEGLAAKRSRANAFAAATEAVRQKHPHPYFWASFVLVGEPGPLPEATRE